MRPAWPVAPLHRYLLAVILLSCAPLSLLVTWQAARDMGDHQQQLQRGLQDSARALAAVVDRELTASTDALDALVAGGLARRLAAGSADAGVAIDSRLLRRGWHSVFMAGPDGTTAVTGPARRLSGPTVGPDGEPATSISVEAGEGWRLGAWIPVRHWQDVLAAAGVPESQPEGGFAGLFNERNLVIARTRDAAAGAAQSLSAGAAEAVGTSARGVGRIERPDGVAMYAAWDRPRPDWGVVIGVPADPVDAAAAWQGLLPLAAAVACLVAGVALAMRVSRRMVEPLAGLAAGDLSAPRSPVVEIAAVQQGLTDALERERAAAEQLRLRAEEMEVAFEISPVAMALCLEGDCRTWRHNRAMRSLVGTWQTPLPERRCDGQPIPAGERALYLAARQGLSIASHEQEWRIAPPLGARWVLVQAEPLLDAAGRPRGAIETVVDVTELKLAQQQLAVTQERLRSARELIDAAGYDGSRANDELLVVLGHELRNPLNAISAAAEVLKALLPDGQPLAQEAREVIERQSGQLSRLTNEVLEMLRLGSEGIEPGRMPLELGQIAAAAAADFERQTAAAGCVFEVRCEAGWILGDRNTIAMLVRKLLEHALLRGRASGRVGVHVVAAADTVSLRVGWGDLGGHRAPLPAQPLSGDVHGGMTLALEWAARLGRQQGAALEWRANTDGAEALLRFERVAVPAGAAAALPAPAKDPAPARTLLLVQGDEEDARTLRIELELSGHTVTHAADGAGGLSLLLAERPEVVIVDIGLSDAAGLTLARQARGAGYSGSMIALSGVAGNAASAQALRAGFDAVVNKPAEPDELRDAIRAAA